MGRIFSMGFTHGFVVTPFQGFSLRDAFGFFRGVALASS